MIAIIDYDMGNIGSVANMLKKIGQKAVITRDPAVIQQADKLILPGVGAFDSGMENLNQFGLIEIIRKRVLDEKTPILGICLGAQLMLNNSEEGRLEGLGLLPGKVVKFKFEGLDHKLRIPFMGWGLVHPSKNHPLTSELPEEPRFYFVHSYHFAMDNTQDELLRSTYGYPYSSAFACNNVAGVQFHPEKSHKFGMALLKNFAEKF